MFLAKKLNKGAGTPAAPVDAQFNYVTMLLHGDGTNGAQNNTFLDSSNNTFTITRNGNTTQGSFSPYGDKWSNHFDGTGDYLSTPNVAALQPGTSTNPFCVECWVYPTNTPASDIAILGNYKVTSYPTNTDGFDILQTSSNRAALRWGYPNYADSGTSAVMALNTWNHIAVCRNSGGSMSCYLNGTRWFNTSTNTSITNATASSFWVGWAGSLSGTTINPFAGYISNARLVKGSAVYDPTSSTLTVPTAPLTAITNTSLLTNFTNGAIFDNAMMNNLETVGNAQISTSVVKYGTGSLNINGTATYGTGTSMLRGVVPNSSFEIGTGDFTVEGWFYQTNVGSTYQSIMEINNHLGVGGILFIGNYLGNASVYAADTGGGGFVAQQATTTNTWQHIAYVRSNGTLRTYVNGVSTSSQPGFTLNIKCTYGLTIGCDKTGNAGYYYYGFMDELRVSRYARYTANFTPPTEAFLNIGPY